FLSRAAVALSAASAAVTAYPGPPAVPAHPSAAAGAAPAAAGSGAPGSCPAPRPPHSFSGKALRFGHASGGPPVAPRAVSRGPRVVPAAPLGAPAWVLIRRRKRPFAFETSRSSSFVGPAASPLPLPLSPPTPVGAVAGLSRGGS